MLKNDAQAFENTNILRTCSHAAKEPHTLEHYAEISMTCIALNGALNWDSDTHLLLIE